METVSETPTERSDYALLSAGYLALLAGVAGTARRSGSGELAARDLVPLSAATFALSKMVVHEKVESWMRAPFVEERPEGRRPRGRRMRYAVGELLTCTRCTGAWGALGLVALRAHAPAQGRLVTTVLAVSAGSDFLHSTFSFLCALGNAESERAELRMLDRRDRTGEDRSGPRVSAVG